MSSKLVSLSLKGEECNTFFKGGWHHPNKSAAERGSFTWKPGTQLTLSLLSYIVSLFLTRCGVCAKISNAQQQTVKSTFKIKSGITVRLVSFYVRVVLKCVYSETRLLIQSLNLTAHEVRVLYLW